MANKNELRPYNFEPVRKKTESESSSKVVSQADAELDLNSSVSGPSQRKPTPDSRRGDPSAWCLCGHCRTMPSELECQCCGEIPAIRTFIETRDSTASCVTLLEDFSSCCLSKTVLEMALVMQRHSRGFSEPLTIKETDTRLV